MYQQCNPEKDLKQDGATIAYFIAAAVAIIVLAALLIGRQIYLGKTSDVLTKKKRDIAPLIVSPAPEATVQMEIATRDDKPDKKDLEETPVLEIPKSEPSPIKPTLPRLSNSDAIFREKISALPHSQAALSLIVPDQAIRKIVRAVHGINEGFIVNEFRPLKSPKGLIEVSQRGISNDDNVRVFVIDKENVKRYQQHISALEAIEPQLAAQVYSHFAPLFEEAYAELGLPNRTFSRSLNSAISRVLSIPLNDVDISATKQLIQPSVTYAYRDKIWESKDSVTKLFFRLGKENTQFIQNWLRQFQTHLN